MIKRQIPNLFTFLNLLAGVLGVLTGVIDRLDLAAFFVFLGIFFDFFDGFFARKFGVSGDLGKELDSLADVVTSGVVPALVMFQLLLHSLTGQWFTEWWHEVGDWAPVNESLVEGLSLIGLLIAPAAAYRLANFNLDERQSNSFIGLPTPAMAIFIVSLGLIHTYQDGGVLFSLIEQTWFLILVTVLVCYLMNAEIPLFSLKIKHFGWKGNEFKYGFLLGVIALLIYNQFAAIPLTIVWYVLLSLLENKIKEKRKG